MYPEQTTITGTFARFRYRASESGFVIGLLADGRCILGHAREGELVPGMNYQFHGRWEEHDAHGEQFRFQAHVQTQQHSKAGVVAYLTRYATGVGPVTAAELWDRYGAEAVQMLRTQPALVASQARYLTLEKAERAARQLQEIAQLEDTKIELVNLFAGRHFPSALVDDCVERWGIRAAARIRRDPFCLLVAGLSGCGFARCDRLYRELGLPIWRLKRQTICLWHVLQEERSGSTWFDAQEMVGRVARLVGSQVAERKAIALGVRSGWLATRQDDAGKSWLAVGEYARDEACLAAHIVELKSWRPPGSSAVRMGVSVELSESVVSALSVQTKEINHAPH